MHHYYSVICSAHRSTASLRPTCMVSAATSPACCVMGSWRPAYLPPWVPPNHLGSLLHSI